MKHRITWTVLNPPAGVAPAKTHATYTDDEFRATFDAASVSALLAGEVLIAKGGMTGIFDSDVMIERSAA